MTVVQTHRQKPHSTSSFASEMRRYDTDWWAQVAFCLHPLGYCTAKPGNDVKGAKRSF